MVERKKEFAVGRHDFWLLWACIRMRAYAMEICYKYTIVCLRSSNGVKKKKKETQIM